MTSEPISISQTSLTEKSGPFLAYLEDWLGQLPALSAAQVLQNPQRCAIFSVDVIKGFCNFGLLASPRVGAIVPPIVALMQLAWQQGLRDIVLTQDTHEPDAVEFGSWPPHCVRGTPESETVDEISALPFFDRIVTLPKNSIDSYADTDLKVWMDSHPQVDTFLVVGDCTDLCVYQMAMKLRTDANARQLQRRVIIPANCVDTYDRGLAAAQEQGGFPHPGDFLHAVFLYHMALNGIEVVREIA